MRSFQQNLSIFTGNSTNLLIQISELNELREQVTTWRLHPVVDALQALRGVPFTVAVTMVADIGDLTRCEPPSALMKFLG